MSDGSPAPSKSSVVKPKPSVKPKAITRKSKAEREEYARLEAERAAERASHDVVPTQKVPAARGRGGARGSRGGATRNDRSATSAGGIFGTGTGSRPERARTTTDLGQSEALDAGTSSTPAAIPPTGIVRDAGEASTTRASGGGRTSKRAVAEEVSYIEHDEPDEQPRRDIERIWLSSDEEEDDVVSRKGKQRRLGKDSKSFGGLRPVRAARVATEQYDNVKEEKNPTIGRSMEESAVIDVESDEMAIDEDPTAGASTLLRRDQPSGPELVKRVIKKSDSSSKTKDTRLLTETIEEKAERLRLREDTQNLTNAFLQKSDSDETVDSKEEETVFGHDRMFLFQFPPLVPQLLDPQVPDIAPQIEVPTDTVQVKAEESGEPQAESSKANAEPPAAVQPTATVFTAETAHTQRFPSGYVGKLNIHKSGKVTIDWGGTDMEVRYGTDVNFLQDVIRVDTPKKESTENDEVPVAKTGKAYALGQAKRKMVLVPDWSKLYA